MGENPYLREYRTYMKIERAFSRNTIDSYMQDLESCFAFLEKRGVGPETASESDISAYLAEISSVRKLSERTQARTVSALRSFYRYMEMEGNVKVSPCSGIDMPKLGRYLPEVLSVSEIESMISSVDLSSPQGHRNLAIVETLYSCGLRVSELVGLHVSDLFLEESFLRVIGKGNKQRLVPVSPPAARAIRMYMSERAGRYIEKGADDILFLNRRGAPMTREMVFIIVRRLAAQAGVKKKISPHTFRHSFATHLVENGADLRSVQEMLGHESILTTEIYTHMDTSRWQNTILEHHPRKD